MATARPVETALPDHSAVVPVSTGKFDTSPIDMAAIFGTPPIRPRYSLATATRHNRSRRSCSGERWTGLHCGSPMIVIFGVFDRKNTPNQPPMIVQRATAPGDPTRSVLHYSSLRGPRRARTSSPVRPTGDSDDRKTATRPENPTTATGYEDSIGALIGTGLTTTARIGEQQHRAATRRAARENQVRGRAAPYRSLLTSFAERVTDYVQTLARSFLLSSSIIRSNRVIPVMKRQWSSTSRRRSGWYRLAGRFAEARSDDATISLLSRTSGDEQEFSLNHRSCIVLSGTSAAAVNEAT